MKGLKAAFAIVFMAGFSSGWIVRGADSEKATSGERERVELITWRTQHPHEGCAKKGYLEFKGQPRRIESYGIDKFMFPHVCTGCGATNEIFDAAWPKIEREWRAVR